VAKKVERETGVEPATLSLEGYPSLRQKSDLLEIIGVLEKFVQAQFSL